MGELLRGLKDEMGLLPDRLPSGLWIRLLYFVVIVVVMGAAVYSIYEKAVTPAWSETVFEKEAIETFKKEKVAGLALGDCEIVPVATLPLLSNGRPLIEVSMNGKTVQMVVDTGAQTSSVTPEAAAMLGLPRDSDRHTVIHTVGGDNVAQYATLEKLSIANIDFRNLSVIVVALGGVRTETPPAGIIGADLLFDYELELDMPRRTLTLYRASGCSPNRPPWEGQYQTISTRKSDSRQFRFPLELNGHSATAQFDTGSRGETVSRTFANSIGITDAQLDKDPVGNGTSGGLHNYSIRRHRFDTFKVGEEVFHNIPLDVVDFRQPGTDMLIGVDYMHWRRFFLSYSGGLLFIQREQDDAIRKALTLQSQANREYDPCRPAPDVLPTLARHPPIVVSRPSIDIPEKARSDHVNGCAAVMFHLAADGTPIDIKPVKESPAGYGLGERFARSFAVARFQPSPAESRWYYEVYRFHNSP